MMFSRLETLIAFRYLRAKRKEGFISVITGFALLGITLGVATLIVVMAVMNGFRTELLDRILGINGHINVQSYQQRLTEYEPLVNLIEAVDGVIRVAPMIDGQVMASTKGISQGALVRGFTKEDLQKKTIVSENIIFGTLDAFEGTDVIIIGESMAYMFNVTIGDTITLIAPQGRATILGTIPRHKQYRIIGLFDVGMSEYNSGTIFMPLKAAQLFFRKQDAVSVIEIMTKNASTIDPVVRKLEEIIGEDYQIIDWQQSNASFFNALKVERTVMFLILTLIIVIAAFNIVSGLIMLVNDKGKDIAILRTMGATRGMIMRIFFMTGASIGVAGTLFGFILGVSFASNIESIRQWLQSLTGSTLFDPVIYYLSELPAEIQNKEVFSVIMMALALSFIATIYPAWKAARLHPAEALRYEA